MLYPEGNTFGCDNKQVTYHKDESFLQVYKNKENENDFYNAFSA